MTHIVLSGGGLKGFALIGFMRALEENKIKPSAISGASIGAIIGVMMSIGYSWNELYDFIENFSYDDVCDFELSSFFEDGGIETGNRISRLFQIMIKNKLGNPFITFQEHYEKTGIWVVVNAVCLNTQTCEYFSYKTHPDMQLCIALRMSMSLPIWFKPVFYNNNIYIDGGLLDNLPIRPFILAGVPKNEIISVKLQRHNLNGEHKHIENNSFSYASALWSCIYNEINKNNMLYYDQNEYNIFYIVTKNISAFTPELPLSEKLTIYEEGYNNSMACLDNYIKYQVQLVLSSILSNVTSEFDV